MKRTTKLLKKTAWEQARDFGIDMSLLTANLRRTPAERIRQHDRARATAMLLRESMRKHHA